jgi:hypothetical protein
MIDTDKIISLAVKEMERLQDSDVILKMNIIQAVKIIALVQLALRHPDLPEENKTFGRKFTDSLIELIERPSPDLAAFCRLGWDDKNDTPVHLVSEATAGDVLKWAQAMLTALNVGDVASGSQLHLKLREVMIAYRKGLEKKNGE